MKNYKWRLLILLLLSNIIICCAQQIPVKITTIGKGWANNSINTVIFRHNSLVSFNGIQYASYYDNDQYMVLAKRNAGSDAWQTQRTPYKINAADAHKTIAIIVDGAGYLHVSWGHHNQNLNYAMSVAPGSLTLSATKTMTGNKENRVTYPEFYKLPNGDLLFLYRDGASGNGNLMMNRYSVTTQKWTRLQDGWIDGEGQRNAYWQMCIDDKSTIHLSWVWRETGDVATNHDLCYARSKDGGVTWEKSTGEKYKLPITAANAEVVCSIPQKSELINQTSTTADAAGHPFIATYWREAGQTIPQYHIVYNTNGKWRVSNLGFRKTPFSLSGGGTKSIPISRPQIVAWQQGKTTSAAIIFRDAERGSKVSMAVTANLGKGKWTISDLSNESVDEWEPSFDTELWRKKNILDIFVQKTIQVDGEGKANIEPQPVQVYEWKPLKKQTNVGKP
jgi:hypothetical protein